MTRLRRTLSVRAALLLLALACAIPPLLFAAFLLIGVYEDQTSRAQAQSLETARALRWAIDRELEGRLRSLEMLATSRSLRAGDVEEFGRQAREAVGVLPPDTILILSVRSGQQLLNTRIPEGQPLPRRRDLHAVEQVFSTGRPHVSNLILSTISGAPALGLDVPVFRDGQVAYDLTMGLQAQVFADLLARQDIPDSWTVSVIDGGGVHIARNRSAQQFVGRPITETLRALMDGRPEGMGESTNLEGEAVLTAFSRSDISGWTVALGVPLAEVTGGLRSYLLIVLGGGAMLMALAALAAHRLAERIANPIRGLAGMARAVGQGGIVIEPTPSGLKEVDVVGTALSAAALARNESEARLRLAVIAGRLGHWELDIATGLIRRSIQHDLIFGYGEPPAVWSYDRFLNHVLREDRGRIDSAFQTAVITGGEWDFECRIRRADGEIRWIAGRGGPGRDAGGPTERLLGILADVTDRKEAEEALRESEARWRELFESMQEGFFIGEALKGDDGKPDFRFIEVNPAFERLTGIPAKAAVGRSVREVTPDVLDEVIEQHTRVVDTGKPVQFEVHAPGIEDRWYESRVRRVGPRRFSALFLDITARKRADIALQQLNAHLEERVRSALEEREQAQQALRQAQKMEAVGQLTGGVAHDFNNLLQVISGNLQLLLRDIGGNERAEQRVRNALSGVSRGSKLASSLLAFARRQPLEPKAVNLGRLVRSLDDMLRRALGEEIEVETVNAGGLWNTLVDPTQVENALLNLAINGRDAMDGRGKLTIETGNAFLDDTYAARHAEVKPGQYVMLAVTDTGCGMTPELIERVFEPFFSTKPEGKGTGLGLSMVYGFVKQSGGHVKIYSEPGQGTTVRLYLPRTLEEERVITDIDAAPVQGGTETVLVVEDDEDVRATVVELLTDLGYTVFKARDAQSALVIVESGVALDLLFTDVVMPGPLRSPELARKARERLPNLAVLFTSGYTENAIVHGGRLDPGVELLSKPYAREALARKVRQVLRKQPQSNAVPSSRPAALPHPRAGTAGASAGNGTFRILLVEDDTLIRMTTAEMLADLGHEVREVESAEEALPILESGAVDLLVTDLTLPGMSGDELAWQARERFPDLRVIIATGHDCPPIDRVVHLQKPYDLAGLEKALQAAGSLPVA